jgi:hypothetical protein
LTSSSEKLVATDDAPAANKRSGELYPQATPTALTPAARGIFMSNTESPTITHESLPTFASRIAAGGAGMDALSDPGENILTRRANHLHYSIITQFVERRSSLTLLASGSADPDR